MKPLIPMASLVAALAAAAAGPAPAAPPALAKAKTVVYTATCVSFDRGGRPKPAVKMIVRVKWPKLLRVDVVPEAGAAGPGSFYLQDGSRSFTYDANTNTYTTDDAPEADEMPLAEMAERAGYDQVFNILLARSTGSGAATTLDGRDAYLITTRQPSAARGSDASVCLFRTWMDAATDLPLRAACSYLQRGRETAIRRCDYADWQIDVPLPPDTFRWRKPAGAKIYTEPVPLAPGTAAPDFTVVKPDGSEMRLSALRGKIVLLDFWATWCGPCQRSMPHLEKVYQRVKDRGVAVLAVAISDERDDYLKWVKEKSSVYHFPTGIDSADRTSRSSCWALYQVPGIPAQFVIGKTGKIVASVVGYSDGSTDMEKALAKAGVKLTSGRRPHPRAAHR